MSLDLAYILPLSNFTLQYLYTINPGYQIEPVVIFNSPHSKTGITHIRFKAANNTQVEEYVQFLKTSWRSCRAATRNPVESLRYE